MGEQQLGAIDVNVAMHIQSNVNLIKYKCTTHNHDACMARANTCH